MKVLKNDGGSHDSDSNAVWRIYHRTFAVIFLIYSNSFLAKRRKKEFGLFQILGMEKKHLAKVLFFESLYLWILSVGGGILLGILCYKLLFLVLLKLTRLQGTIHFAFHWKATGNTVVLFAVIFLINYLKSLHQIHAAQPIELLHGEQEGEREPKTKLLPHGSDCSVWDLVIIWH